MRETRNRFFSPQLLNYVNTTRKVFAEIPRKRCIWTFVSYCWWERSFHSSLRKTSVRKGRRTRAEQKIWVRIFCYQDFYANEEIHENEDVNVISVQRKVLFPDTGSPPTTIFFFFQKKTRRYPRCERGINLFDVGDASMNTEASILWGERNAFLWISHFRKWVPCALSGTDENKTLRRRRRYTG